jgi:amino acid transporter
MTQAAWKSYFILVSTIIGLGVFFLPYTFYQSGYYFLYWLIFWFFGFLILHLIFGEILFQSSSKHNLPGLAGIYLNKYIKHIVWFFDYFGMMGVFLIYFYFIKDLWSYFFKLDPLLAKIIFAVFNLYFILKDIKILAKMETFLTLSIICLFLIITIFLLPKVDLLNVKNAFFNSSKPLLPYGIILFAFSGISALPVVIDLIGKDKKSYFLVNLFSLLTIAFIYLIFSLVVVGFLGSNIKDKISEGFIAYLPSWLVFVSIFLITLNITFVDMAFYLKRGLIYDYNLNIKIVNWIMFFSILFLAFFEPFQNLIDLVDFVSRIFLGFNLIIISLIYLRLKEKKYFKFSNFLIITLLIIFCLGIIYGILPR